MGRRPLALIFILSVLSLGFVFPAAGNSSRSAFALERGERAFAECVTCHTLSTNGKHGAGPNLYGIFGRKIASAPGFSYSESLLALDGLWDEDTLNRYIARPKFIAPDNIMAYPGLQSPHARADLISWFKTKPEFYESDLLTQVERSTSARWQSLSRSCKTCHSVTKGARSKIGPNLWGIIGREFASVPDFSYSNDLASRRGVWTAEALNKFFTETRKANQGTHFAFRALKSQSDRAEVIAWLSSLREQEFEK